MLNRKLLDFTKALVSISDLEKGNNDLKKDNDDLKKDNNDFKIVINDLRKDNIDLRKDNNDFKKYLIALTILMFSVLISIMLNKL